MRARVVPPVIAAGLLAAGLLAGCTSAGRAPATPPASTVVSTVTVSPSPPSTVPAAPTVAATATACPFVSTSFVRSTMGMRLGRVSVLRSAGATVGCRFYALQGGPLHQSEHLPGPRQPVVEIVTWRYPTAVAAHNAFVLAARGGGDVGQAPLGGSRVGLCYQTDFYPKDHGQDWACGTSIGAVRVLVRTVDTTGTFSTLQVTRTVLDHV